MERLYDLLICLLIGGGLCAVAWIMTEIYYAFKEAYERKERRINAYMRRNRR